MRGERREEEEGRYISHKQTDKVRGGRKVGREGETGKTMPLTHTHTHTHTLSEVMAAAGSGAAMTGSSSSV